MLIAEVGLTHDGSLGNALAFIDAVKDAGADAVKFQCHFDDLNIDLPESGCVLSQDASRLHYWARTDFSVAEWACLYLKSRQRQIRMGITPFSMSALGKIGSMWDFLKISRNHVESDMHQMAKRLCGNARKPLLWTGAGCLGLNEYQDHIHTGISDHSGAIENCLDAARRGAQIFEVHVCWDKRQFGPDIPYSITIDQLAELAERLKK